MPGHFAAARTRTTAALHVRHGRDEGAISAAKKIRFCRD